MLNVAYNWEGAILTKVMLTIQIFDADDYCRFLPHHLYPDGRRKRPRFSQNSIPIMLNDNDRCHVSNIVTLLLRQWQWEILKYPTYSPKMNLCDFDLFPKLKELLQDCRFMTFHLYTDK
ncbi:hypothetical protein TNCV_2631761 [Trichonephila clavipes]|nr:hypothetical protein TNCV_2631761 [Trichonephila clavipes]